MFKHGFKTTCENLALHYRKQLAIESHAPINVHTFSDHLNIKLLTPKDIICLPSETITILIEDESHCWSAVTLSNNNSHIIIYNSTHSLARQSNDIMHELSHVILDHKPQALHSYEAELFLRHYDEIQEKEADWLAATILLPKDALFKIKKDSLTIRVASNKYGVSEQLLEMRFNTSGVNRILQNTRNKYN